jgi:magnesium chelatase subunit H
VNVTVLYVGSSLLAPLRNAEREINRDHRLDLRLSVHNFGAPFTDAEWSLIESDLTKAEVVFVIHVMDGENAARLLPLLDRRAAATIVINCMPELMKRTRMGKLDFAKLPGVARKEQRAKGQAQSGKGEDADGNPNAGLIKSISSWIGRQAKGKGKNGAAAHGRAEYLKWAERLPGLLRFVPNAGKLRDAKNYLLLMSYFLQPTPNNIRAMIMLALKEYVDDERLTKIEVPAPEVSPSVAIYHPDAPALFESFADYERWYRDRSPKFKVQSPTKDESLAAESTIGLLLMRPQIVSKARGHYDSIIRAIEAEGLSVIPAISTLMDNREACEKFFVGTQASGLQKGRRVRTEEQAGGLRTARISQIVSLTGFSFVGGPAMNDSVAASAFLSELNIPYRSLVSLDTQTIESWRESFTGLNPVQTGMQIAIPEIDGATEPFVFGGIPARGIEPAALEDRCARIARRLKRWNRLQTTTRDELRIALVVYCFPPNKGNIGTAADLDVFASVFDTLTQLKHDGYQVDIPANSDALRDLLLGGNSAEFDSTANIAYQMKVEEYRQFCPFVNQIEAEWGPAPGAINSAGEELLIQGITLGNVFIGVQPTFGFEDDPMRLLMARGGAPHHGFAAFYSYLEKVFRADAVVHVGTHGAMEFMPGKQVGMSVECWPDRLIGELPNIYIYSVNNPSEGTIAKRRSYAELISYLTPPIESAGLYKGLAALKDLIESYRSSADEGERERIYLAIEDARKGVNLELS